MTAQPERHLSLVPGPPGDDPEPGEPDDRPLAEVRAATGFAWTCRKAVTENRHVTEVHHVTGSDRGEYERHMREHALTPPLKSAYRRWKPWTTPRPRQYAPKPMDAGQRADWLQVTPGHWEGRTWIEASGTTPGHFEGGTWIEETRQARTGTIWSVADTASAWWVQPDDDPAHPVYVRRARRRDYPAAEGTLIEIPQAADAARANIIRGNLVRERGIYPVIDHQSNWDRTARTYLTWHTDQACPRADGKDRYDPARPPDGLLYGYQPEYGQPPWTPLQIAAALAKGGQPPSEFCPDCITGLDTDAAPAPGPEPAPDTADTSTRDKPDGIPAVNPPGPEAVTVPGKRESAPEAPPAPAMPGGRRRPARFALRLEPPASDEEFLASCDAIGTALTSLAGHLAAWTGGLRELHFPASIFGPLDQTADAVTGAAAGAARAAAAFEDEFSDARGIAARGMHITGQDTA